MTATLASPVSGRNLIAGHWRSGRETFPSISPADLDSVVGVFPRSPAEDAHRAVEAARAAFPAWRRTSRILRAECFDNLAQLIKRDTDSLAHLMARECGKVVTECRAEVIEGLHMVQYVCGTGRMPMGVIVASEIAEKDAFIRRKPRGVVAVITPWNFPFAVPLWMLGPSLLEGNTAVFKPSEDTPAVGQRLVELFVEAGFPPGVLNLVHGAGEVGEALTGNPDVNAILFTGSWDVGSRIQQVSAPMADRVVAAEMGGKNAVIICDDARQDLAVNAALISAFKTSGQRCVSASRILIHESRFESVARELVEKARRIRIGDPLDAGNFTGPVIHRDSVAKIQRYNALAREEGATILLDGGPMTSGEHGRGCYMSPFIYRMDYTPEKRCLREEVFGPHLALVPFKTNEEAVTIYNATPYGLSLAVVTENYRNMRWFRDECDFGLGYVNLPCIGAEVHLPFGGVKQSGNGRPSAAGLVDSITHPIAWTVNHGTEIKMAQGLTV